MTKEERLSYGNLILKVVCDISAPQAKYCSTLSAPTKNLKRRLSNMVNTKKSRRSMVALSVLFAFIICSFATIYAFAASIGTPTDLEKPDNIIIDLPEDADVNDDIPVDNRAYEFKVPGGVYGIGYTNADGEESSRISMDGGVTWYIPTDDYDYENYILDTDIPAIEWLNYDDFKAWINNKKAELSDEDIEYYESELENMKNGIGEAGVGKVIIENREIIFVFNAETSDNTVTYTISDGETWQICSQEQIDNIISMYEIITNDSSLSNLPTITIDGVDIYSIIYDGIKTIRAMESYVYAYIQPEDGEKMGFGGDTFAHLKRLVRIYFNERVETGKMTREDADIILAGITNDNTRVILDCEGNIIE